MSSTYRHPNPVIQEALEYLESTYGLPASDITRVTVDNAVGEPFTHITVTLVARHGRPAEADTVRVNPRTVQVPFLGQTRDEAPRTTETLCICPRNGAGRIGTDPGCPVHQPGAAGLHAVPTERLERGY